MPAGPVDWDAATDECVRLLQRLIRFDTSNPPGNETPAARWIAEVLAAEGVEAEVLEPVPGRGNVVARLPARRQPPAEPPLLLMGHLDVVPADPEGWTHPPFGGAVADGCVWGRGALDMKGTVATWLELFLLLRRTGLPLRRDVVFMASADEEAGGIHGARWLVEQHWPKVACSVALNEGGGAAERLGGVTYYTVQTAEKAPVRCRLVARGRPGHGSIPHDDNAVVHLARAVAALGEARLPVHVTPAVRAFLEGVAAHQPPEVAEGLRALLDPDRTDEVLASEAAGRLLTAQQRQMLRALLGNSCSPTMLQAGSRVNVIPAVAEAVLDVRILPGQTPASVRAELEAVLRRHGLDRRVAVEVEPGVAEPNETEFSGPVVDAIRRALERHAPGSVLVPYMLTGATDGRYFRPRGVQVFGFFPLLPDVDLTTVHGIDERIPIASLRFALQVVWDVLVELCGEA